MGKPNKKQHAVDEAMRRYGNRFGVPHWTHRVDTAGEHSLFNRIPSDIKSVQAVGRTTWLQPKTDPAEIHALARAAGVFDYVKPEAWRGMSPTYKLDTIATVMLLRDRLRTHERVIRIREEVVARGGSVYEDPFFRSPTWQHGILSPRQAWVRGKREIPLKVSAVEVIKVHRPWVIKKF